MNAQALKPEPIHEVDSSPQASEVDRAGLVYCGGLELECEPLPLFIQPRFVRLHADDRDIVHAQLRNADDGRTRAAFTCVCIGDQAVSPYRGPYGGYYIDPTLDIKAIEQFVASTELELSSRGQLRQMTLTLAPVSHGPTSHARLLHVLMCRGYRVLAHDLAHDRALKSGEFVAGVSATHRKSIRRHAGLGSRFECLPGQSGLGEAHALIARNRQRRGHPLTMSCEALLRAAAVLPGSYSAYGVRCGEMLVAAAICVRVDASVLYVFYWGDDDPNRRVSPIPLLAEGLCEHALHLGYERLDVGTSTVDGVPNHGLIQFKESLGFAPASKFVLTRNCAHNR